MYVGHQMSIIRSVWIDGSNLHQNFIKSIQILFNSWNFSCPVKPVLTAVRSRESTRIFCAPPFVSCFLTLAPVDDTKPRGWAPLLILLEQKPSPDSLFFYVDQLICKVRLSFQSLPSFNIYGRIDATLSDCLLIEWNYLVDVIIIVSHRSS